jgi:hypothetical protein
MHVNDMCYAVASEPGGCLDAGPTRLRQGGRDLLFDENFAHCAKFSSKSYIMYHTAAGEAGCHQVRYPV